MKALGYTMFVGDYPDLQIETSVGLRYKPDLVARDEHGRFTIWGECGQVSMRKIGWLLKHARVEHLVIFKIAVAVLPLIEELRAEVAPKYRAPGRVEIVNFVSNIVELTLDRHVPYVPFEWYTTHIV